MEPLDRIFLGDFVAESKVSSADLSLGNSVSWSGQADEEVHTVDTSGGIVLDTQINVFVDTESKVSSFREISLKEFVFLDLQSTLKDLKSLISTDSDMDSDLL